MSMRSLESAILAELREVCGSKKVRLKDIMEWSTSPVDQHDDEVLYYLPKLSVHVSVKVQA